MGLCVRAAIGCQANKEDIKSRFVSPKKTNDSMERARNAQKNPYRFRGRTGGEREATPYLRVGRDFLLISPDMCEQGPGRYGL